MKCLSLWQPWATLVVIGAKRIETRHWETNFKGQLLIHAAKKWNRELSDMCWSDPFRTCLNEAGYEAFCGDWQEGRWEKSERDRACCGNALPLGKIVGVCNLVKCWPTNGLHHIHFGDGPALTDQERAFGNYAPGRYGWLLTNVRRFPTPVPCVGRQQLFNVPDELVADQLAKAVPA